MDDYQFPAFPASTEGRGFWRDGVPMVRVTLTAAQFREHLEQYKMILSVMAQRDRALERLGESVMTSNADRQRAYRARNGALVGGRRGPAPTAPCGTVSGYKGHKRRGEPIDDACRLAYNAEQRRLYAARKGSK